MAKKSQRPIVYDEVPETLDDQPTLFKLVLDEEQKAFRDAIWSTDKLVVFCNARAGCGKTTIAVMTAKLLCDYHRYDGIVYITAPVQEGKVGFLPGTVQEKMEIYNQPFYEAAIKANINLYTDIENEDMENAKNGSAYIQCRPHNYMRGCTFENKVVIIDEAQNYYGDELKKVLTRMSDSCKVIVIGHTGQCDLFSHPERSGFAPYLAHFEDVPWAAICNLTHNYRGMISSHADSLIFS